MIKNSYITTVKRLIKQKRPRKKATTYISALKYRCTSRNKSKT